ncbi:MAG TPA: hypothetical protein VIS76_07110 [Pseudomonadales bacterium]
MVLRDCVFYRVEEVVVDSQVLSTGRMSGYHKMHWCTHAESPVQMWEAFGTADGGSKLKCNGELANCPLRCRQFADA